MNKKIDADKESKKGKNNNGCHEIEIKNDRLKEVLSSDESTEALAKAIKSILNKEKLN